MSSVTPPSAYETLNTFSDSFKLICNFIHCALEMLVKQVKASEKLTTVIC